MLVIGVAMLQGSRHEHIHSLQIAAEKLSLDIEIRELRKAEQIEGINGLILPGGESTAMKIAGKYEDLFDGLWNYVRANEIPVLGTCAGAILLSQQNLISTKIARNAFGRQIDSFEKNLRLNFPEDLSFHGIFIRAPRFVEDAVNPIAWLEEEVVGVHENNIVALTFHPELTSNTIFHEWLISSANNS